MSKLMYLLGIFVSLNLHAQTQKPKLVVSVVVDQMKPEYLTRFSDDFGPDGFKRLQKEGFEFKNMNYNYSPTYTAPGHASIFTGTTPRDHGIIGNSYYTRLINDKRYCTDDSSVSAVGEAEEAYEGQMSPNALHGTTISDQLKLDSNFKSKVFAVSLKDRGAILPVGHFANSAYWMSSNGNFISSSYYMKELPKYVEKFNKEDLVGKYLKGDWKPARNIKNYTESYPVPDNNEFEIQWDGQSAFPHELSKISKDLGREIIKSTPFGNDALLAFAKTIIENEKLGNNEVTDYLSISFSSTDYIGHVFGSRSIEIQDTYIRLDENIAELLHFLDKNVGKGQYLLFLTADHAAAENPQYLKSHGYQVSSINEKNERKALIEYAENKFGKDVIQNFSNLNLFLNYEKISELGLTREAVKEGLTDYLLQRPFIKMVYDTQKLIYAKPESVLMQNIINGIDPKQNGDLIVLLQPEYMFYAHYGTTHGSPYSYDTWVPMLWFGTGIKPGVSHRRVEITQIAPTATQKIGVNYPSLTTSDVLSELFD